MTTNQLELMREPERQNVTGLSRVHWWRLERAGRVPRRIRIGDNSVAWLRHEIQEWIAKRAAQR